MHISPFLFIATFLVPYVFAHGAPPSQEDSLTPHAHLRTREDLAEVSDLHRRAPPKAAPKPAKPVAAITEKPVAAVAKKLVAAINKKPVAAVNKKRVAAVNKKPLAAVNKKRVAAVNKKPVAAINKKPLTAVNKKPVAAVNKKALTAVPKKPAAGANGKTAAGARQPKAVGTKAVVKQSGTACGRRVHRRSIYNDLYGRTDTCEIELNLQTHTTKEMHTETIKVRPSENLGASNPGIVSAHNRAVYKIDEWNGQQGPFIAKQFNTAKDKSKEAGNLAQVGHLIAASPKGSPDDNSWAVMKHVPGKPLIGSEEHKTAMAKPKNEANDWMMQRHQQLADTVAKLETDTGLLHADLKNDNVHWEHHTDGSSTPHLLDFGQMAKTDDNKEDAYKNNGVPADKQSPEGYALHRAQAIYPLKQ